MFRFNNFMGSFYSLKCVATRMNHNAFQWVEIAILLGLGGGEGIRLGRAELGWEGREDFHKKKKIFLD